MSPILLCVDVMFKVAMGDNSFSHTLSLAEHVVNVEKAFKITATATTTS